MEETDNLKEIIAELLQVIKDNSYPEDFRLEIKHGLIDIKDEIDRTLLEYL